MNHKEVNSPENETGENIKKQVVIRWDGEQFAIFDTIFYDLIQCDFASTFEARVWCEENNYEIINE